MHVSVAQVAICCKGMHCVAYAEIVSLCFSKWQGQRDRDRDRETVMFEMCASKGLLT